MTPLSTLVDDVRREVPGCRRPFIIDALKTAAQDFCRRSLIWQRDIPTIEANTHCTAVLLTSEGACLTCSTDKTATDISDTMIWKDTANICDEQGYREAVPADAMIVQVLTDQDTSCFSYEHAANTLVIRTTAQITGMKVALMPLGENIPDSIFALYREGFRTGALWKLHSMRGQSWSDRESRDLNRIENERYIREAGSAKANGFMGGPKYVGNSSGRVGGLP